jgi:multicomponent Na+:H+ antiporter subunit D
VSPGQLLPLVVAVPLLSAALLVTLGRLVPRSVADAAGIGCAAATGAVALVAMSGAGPAVEWVGGWTPTRGHSVGIVLVGDPVGLGLVALVSVLVVAVLVYSWRYFDEPPRGHGGAFPGLVLLFQAGMSGFAITGDLFNAFVFFELMGVVAYALTGYRVDEARAVQGALTFGVVNSLGAYATLLGIGVLYARTGELGLAQIGRALDEGGGRPGHPDALVIAAFVLVVTGLLVKAAAVPFHFWLPDAYAVAPTPVCMLLAGVTTELGIYGVLRVYVTVFGGPGGIPAADAQRALLVLGVATALVGAVMCWQQRHLKRMLAFSVVSHVGLFLIGLASLTPEGIGGTALYILGNAGVNAALFACVGIVLDRHGNVDEHELHGRARDLPLVGALFVVGGLALAGLPPFGVALGKGVVEEAAGHAFGEWMPALFVVVSAVTGATVLRAGARVFYGLGPHPHSVRDEVPETTGQKETPETGAQLRRSPRTMLAVPAVLLACALAVGTVPWLASAAGRAADRFVSHALYLSDVLGGAGPPPPASPAPGWTWAAVALGVASTALSAALATAAVRRPIRLGLLRCTAPLRRLHSGHIGDYVAWLIAGIALLAVLTAA